MSSLRAILAKVPVNVRTGLLESMSFANGKLINMKIKDVQGVLSKGDVQALMRSCGCTTEGYACSSTTAGECVKLTGYACDAAACKGSKGAVIVQLGTLLQGAPSTARRHFLDSLDFEKGHLTSVDIDLLKEHVGKAKIKQLPRVISK